MSVKTLNLKKDLCRCCLSEGKFQSLSQPKTSDGKVTVYSEMLKSCLNIEISPVQGGLSALTYTICDACIERIEEANSFKQQVLQCEELFKYMYCEYLNNVDVVKMEVSTDDEIQVEFLQNDGEDRFDIKFNDSDDEPVVHIKDEMKKEEEDIEPTKVRARQKKQNGPKKTAKGEKKKPRKIFELTDSDYKKDGEIFICQHCNKRYEKRSALRGHIKTIHYKLPKHICSCCKQTFMTPAPLTVHLLEQHNIDERAKCKACNAAFNTKVQLRKHINTFHMLGEKHKCDFCDYETFSFEGLYKHKFKHKTVKDYQCRFCKKAFLRKATLQLHERIHTGDRRKVCNVCGQAFVQKASLNYHMTKYHPEVNF